MQQNIQPAYVSVQAFYKLGRYTLKYTQPNSVLFCLKHGILKSSTIQLLTIAILLLPRSLFSSMNFILISSLNFSPLNQLFTHSIAVSSLSIFLLQAQLIILPFHCPPSSQFLKLIFHSHTFPPGNFCSTFHIADQFSSSSLFVSLSLLPIGGPIREDYFPSPRRLIKPSLQTNQRFCD